MSLDPKKHVFGPGDGEALEWSGPVAGRVSIMVDPTKTGSTELCVLIQTLNPGEAVPTVQSVRGSLLTAEQR